MGFEEQIINAEVKKKLIEEHGLNEEAAEEALLKTIKPVICQSCGMPMKKPEEFGGGDTNSKYCKYCCNEDGSLKSREEVRKNMIKWVMDNKGAPKKEAQKAVDELMNKMPAWKK